MKKPNITEGEWYEMSSLGWDYNVYATDSEEPSILNNPTVAKDLSKEDAQAVSAVPDMIDIGIRILHKLQSETESVTAIEQWDLEQALRKAGCTDA